MYVTASMIVNTLKSMVKFENDLDNIFNLHGLALRENTGRRNQFLSLAQEKYLAEELSKKDIVSILQQTTPSKPTDGDWNPEEKISVQQVSFIDNKCRQLDINVLSFINSGDQRYGSIQDITKEKASSMLIILNKYQNGNMEIPEDIKVYDENWRN